MHHTKIQGRLYDHLNATDPVNSTLSEVDQVRLGANVSNLRRLRKDPELPPIFNDNPHKTVKLDSAHSWRGQAEHRRNVLPPLVGVPLTPAERRVTGAECKYFESDFRAGLPTPYGNDWEEPTRHVTVQTDYRDSEAQTDPYSAEYVVKPGSDPSELLQLRSLTWGHGLPAGPAEVEKINQARARRAEEALLPPLNDLSQLHKRRQMMENMETKKWNTREQEIRRSQDSCLAAFEDQLRQRDDTQEAIAIERLNRLSKKCQTEREAGRRQITHDHFRALRGLEAKRANVEGKRKCRDIVTDFCSFWTHKKALANIKKKKYAYQELERMEASLHPLWVSLTPNDIKARCKPRVNKGVEQLTKYKALLEEEKQPKVEKPLRFLIKKEKPPPRPVTPRVEAPPEGEEEIELAIIAIQSMLRHKCIRSEVIEGVRNHRTLLDELLMANPLTPEDQEIRRADRELVMALQKQRQEEREQIAREEEVHNKQLGTELALLFDTLAKERVRQQEEYKIHTFTGLGEEERKRRECEEGGRRHADEQRRKENDEIFKQVMQTHHESVDMFMDDIISASMEQFTTEQAKEHIIQRAKELNDEAYALEERDSVQSEEIVSELVHGFLIPNVKKTLIRQKVHLKELAVRQAAQSVVQDAAGIHPEQTSEPTCSAPNSPNQAQK